MDLSAHANELTTKVVAVRNEVESNSKSLAFDDLCDDVVHHVLKYLNPKERLRLERVNSWLQQLLSSVWLSSRVLIVRVVGVHYQADFFVPRTEGELECNTVSHTLDGNILEVTFSLTKPFDLSPIKKAILMSRNLHALDVQVMKIYVFNIVLALIPTINQLEQLEHLRLASSFGNQRFMRSLPLELSPKLLRKLTCLSISGVHTVKCLFQAKRLKFFACDKFREALLVQFVQRNPHLQQLNIGRVSMPAESNTMHDVDNCDAAKLLRNLTAFDSRKKLPFVKHLKRHGVFEHLPNLNSIVLDPIKVWDFWPHERPEGSWYDKLINMKAMQYVRDSSREFVTLRLYSTVAKPITDLLHGRIRDTIRSLGYLPPEQLKHVHAPQLRAIHLIESNYVYEYEPHRDPYHEYHARLNRKYLAEFLQRHPKVRYVSAIINAIDFLPVVAQFATRHPSKWIRIQPVLYNDDDYDHVPNMLINHNVF